MQSKLTHIGIKQLREQGFRYKRLRNSGIFYKNDTREKLRDCQGPFDQWKNIEAKEWIHARVREQKEGRRVHIVCDCCDLRDVQSSTSHKVNKPRNFTRVNPNCFGGELVNLIIALAGMD